MSAGSQLCVCHDVATQRAAVVSDANLLQQGQTPVSGNQTRIHTDAHTLKFLFVTHYELHCILQTHISLMNTIFTQTEVVRFSHLSILCIIYCVHISR